MTVAWELLLYRVLQVERTQQEEENVSDLRDKNWLELCEAASREQDPQKLLELITTLNDLLEQRDLEQTKRMITRTQAWSEQHSAPYSERAL